MQLCQRPSRVKLPVQGTKQCIISQLNRTHLKYETTSFSFYLLCYKDKIFILNQNLKECNFNFFINKLTVPHVSYWASSLGFRVCMQPWKPQWSEDWQSCFWLLRHWQPGSHCNPEKHFSFLQVSWQCYKKEFMLNFGTCYGGTLNLGWFYCFFVQYFPCKPCPLYFPCIYPVYFP